MLNVVINNWAEISIVAIQALECDAIIFKEFVSNQFTECLANGEYP